MVPSAPPPNAKATTARVSPHFSSSRDASTTFPLTLNGPTHIPPRKKKPAVDGEEDEIDIFPAEKYFSGSMDGPEALLHRRTSPSVPPKDREAMTVKPEAPSVCSDSSANSLKSLLRGRRSSSLKKGTAKRSLLDVIRCNCAESVQVDLGSLEKTEEGTRTTEPSTFVAAEAFDSSLPKGRNGGDEDEWSEASSDLFEIESISTNTYPCFTQGQHAGGTAVEIPSTCYEPSKASVEWSVVTASMAMDTDCGEEAGAPAERRRQHHRGGLLGCNSHQVVLVSRQGVLRAAAPDGKAVAPDGKAVESPRPQAPRMSIEERRAADLRYARPGSPWVAAVSPAPVPKAGNGQRNGRFG